MNISEILQENCWSVICSNNNGDDAEITWLVVGYFMEKPQQRVIGQASEIDGVNGAIKDALSTVKDYPHAYQYEYKK
jgi:hypothetical protein